VEKTIDLSIMWFDVLESMKEKGDKLIKQELIGCAKVIMSKVEIECIV